jgi:hypothetical protein
MEQRLDDIKKGVVKIIGDNDFSGTGFFITKQQCITCHHVIYTKKEISIEVNGQRVRAEWDENNSYLENDISTLVVRDKNLDITPLYCAQELTPSLEVSVWGFTGTTEDMLASGSEYKGTLTTTQHAYTKPPDEKFRGSQPWNKKPKVNVDVYDIPCDYVGSGLSGSPVWESNRGLIVGIFVAAAGANLAKDQSTRGFVIPIDVLIKRQKEKLKSSSATGELIGYMDKANRFFYSHEFVKAIELYGKVIRDENFVSSLENMGKAHSSRGDQKLASMCFEIITNLYSLERANRKITSLEEIS